MCSLNVFNTIKINDFQVVNKLNLINYNCCKNIKLTGPVVVNLGTDIYEVSEEAPVVLPHIDVSIARITSFAANCTVNPNDPGSIEASGINEAGDSQTCDITNDYRPILFPQLEM